MRPELKKLVDISSVLLSEATTTGVLVSLHQTTQAMSGKHSCN